MKSKLRLKESQINDTASRYEYSNGENDLIEMQPRIRNRGFLTAEELYKVA